MKKESIGLPKRSGTKTILKKLKKPPRQFSPVFSLLLTWLSFLVTIASAESYSRDICGDFTILKDEKPFALGYASGPDICFKQDDPSSDDYSVTCDIGGPIFGPERHFVPPYVIKPPFTQGSCIVDRQIGRSMLSEAWETLKNVTAELGNFTLLFQPEIRHFIDSDASLAKAPVYHIPPKYSFKIFSGNKNFSYYYGPTTVQINLIQGKSTNSTLLKIMSDYLVTAYSNSTKGFACSEEDYAGEIWVFIAFSALAFCVLSCLGTIMIYIIYRGQFVDGDDASRYARERLLEDDDHTRPAVISPLSIESQSIESDSSDGDNYFQNFANRRL